jgi:hypothetical protein
MRERAIMPGWWKISEVAFGIGDLDAACFVAQSGKEKADVKVKYEA